MESMELNTDYSAKYSTIPLAALNVSCRRRLSLSLNCEMPLPSSLGHSRNWQGLLELMGFPYATVQLLQHNEDPTRALLDLWEKESQPMVSELLEFLELIERQDVIDDIMTLVERDCKVHSNRVERERRRLENLRPVQDSRVSSVASQRYCPITVSEVNSVSHTESPEDVPQETYEYDAYVSYVEADIDFVLKMIQVLENDYRLKLFVKERDMLCGIPESEADLRMIHERCERILLIISPAFLSDPKCEFYTMFAQAQAVDNSLYARKVIPVICEPCQLPVRLKYIARVDYTKKDYFESFWHRLYSSIKKPPQGELSPPTMSWNSTGCDSSPPGTVDMEASVPLIGARTSSFTSTLRPNPNSVFREKKDSPSATGKNQIEMATLSDQITVGTTHSGQHKKSPKPRTKLKHIFTSLATNSSRHSE